MFWLSLWNNNNNNNRASFRARLAWLPFCCCCYRCLFSLNAVQGFATTNSNHPTQKVAVIGGGASGIFAAISAATSDSAKNVHVTVLEATSKTLAKVKISGGGRCNLLHDTSKPLPIILQGYPRGRRELNGPYHKGFGPRDAQEWFESHGVDCKTEEDGRMFPVSDSSQTVIDALMGAARDAGVELRMRCRVNEIVRDKHNNRLQVMLTQKVEGEKTTVTESFDSVILATGSSPVGYKLAAQLGHSIVDTVPSLFTLNTRDELDPDTGRFFGLSGLSVPRARITLRGATKKEHLTEEGPLLITHHGLSGPAALRLSAFGARQWHELGYHGQVMIHWANHCGNTDDIFEALWEFTTLRPKKTVKSFCPLPAEDGEGLAIPRRLWAAMCKVCGVTEDQVWGLMSKKSVRKLAMQVAECTVNVTGKGQFKEEFGK